MILDYKDMNYKAISLFSGAMGLDLGIEKAGFEIKVCCEMNKWAAETIRENTNIPVIEDDINNVPTEKILSIANLRKEDVSLVVGGPPCQAFSSAGRQKGLADFRGNVIIQYLRVISEIRPQYFILENVRGLLSAKINAIPEGYEEYLSIIDFEGSVLYFLAREFEKQGYTISYALFNAANYGVPQNRERMIIFGNKGKERIPLPQPTHSEDGAFGTKKWITLGDAIKDLKPPHESEYIHLRPKSIKYVEMLKGGENWTSLPPEMAKEAMGKAYSLAGGKTGFYRRLSFDRPSPTLVTSPTMPATLLCHPTESRPLSIKEYARIQQFPDNWIFKGKIADIYKQIGNAVPVGLGYMAGMQIILFDQKLLSPNSDRNNKIPYSRYKYTTDREFMRKFSEKLIVQPRLF